MNDAPIAAVNARDIAAAKILSQPGVDLNCKDKVRFFALAAVYWCI